MWAMTTWTRSWRRTTPLRRSGTSCRGISWRPIPGENFKHCLCNEWSKTNLLNKTKMNNLNRLSLQSYEVQDKLGQQCERELGKYSTPEDGSKSDVIRKLSGAIPLFLFLHSKQISFDLVFRVWRVLSSQQTMDLRVPGWSGWTQTRSHSAISSRRRMW